ncbi:TIGR03089 family protein [Sanguibacter gelidistatuariae]|uniref:TIGR03089 family protein n=1 Tax=Sanguibacter gelidistatuariae TaxID=1814289 RepID=A0A1G6VXE3_9MICO|nr:TIGR03089 family protein [Sanguibacter gelidistatuariae]SDD58093.1 TIGR03089 family protein [Sanguibacter gelidistatuariae]
MTSTIAQLLTLISRDGGQPRLTWYGTDGERIELSGAVLVNWVNKTTNLLVEEFDAEAGTSVATDLPPHWRTLVWALAVWRAGAELRLVDAGDGAALAGQPDVVLTDHPAAWAPPAGERSRTELVAVSLPALARRFDGDLPGGAVDAASAVMTYGDQLGYVPPADPGATALSGAGVALEVDHAALLGWGVEHAGGGAGTGERVLVRTSGAAGAVAGLLARALSVWASGGSVVVLGPETTVALDGDPARLGRLVETERVTVA